MPNELKPCPFCGCDEAGTKWHHGYWSVACGYNHDATPSSHCFQDWGEFETEKEAIEAWNNRTDERLKGEWVSYLDGNHIMPYRYCFCSICNTGGYTYESNYCPHCGADMRKENADV